MRMNLAGRTLQALILAGALGLGPAAAPAQDTGATVVYTPPLRGAPSSAVRVGGGTRGTGERTFALSVLAPGHVGLTVREQPTLYWFNSEPTRAPAELTIVEAEGFDTLLQLRLDPPVDAGVHALDLAEHGVRLERDKTYQWFVALVVDPDQRSSDVVAAGEIRRVAPPPGIPAEPAAAVSTGALAALARGGLWYDAIDGVSRRVAERPGDAALREQRASLLEQVGLAQAASFERRAAP